MPYTLGFADAQELAEHFEKHITIRGEIVVTTAAEYEQLADTFLGIPVNAHTHECHRQMRDGSRGDTIRYNRMTQEYGILSKDNVIRSYYIVDPRVHRKGSNYDYWRWDCSRIKG